MTPTEVARKLGIGRSSVYRAIRQRKIKRQPASILPTPDKSGPRRGPQCFWAAPLFRHLIRPSLRGRHELQAIDTKRSDPSR